MEKNNLLLTTYVSDKLRLLSFLAIVMIVFLHSYNAHLLMDTYSGSGKYQSVLFLQKFIGDGLCRVAVPFFFGVSGFLFFVSYKKPYWRVFFRKLRARIRTLLVPYFLWSILTFLFFALLSDMRLTRSMFNSEVDITNPFYYIVEHPVAYQLWFLKELFLYVLIAPLIFWMIKGSQGIILLILFAIWIVPNGNILFLQKEGILFFVLGAFLAMYGRSRFLTHHVSHTFVVAIGLFWVLLVGIKTYGQVFGEWNWNFVYYCLQISKLCGMVFLWFFIDWVFAYLHERINQIAGFSFFIFILHEPLLTILKKIYFFLIGISVISSLIAYFILPIFCILLIYAIGLFIKNRASYSYQLLTGGR